MSTQLFHISSTDYTWLFNDSSTWTAVETNIGIVSGEFISQDWEVSGLKSIACLPSLRPILTACLSGTKTNRRSKSSDEDSDHRHLYSTRPRIDQRLSQYKGTVDS